MPRDPLTPVFSFIEVAGTGLGKLVEDKARWNEYLEHLFRNALFVSFSKERFVVARAETKAQHKDADDFKERLSGGGF